MSEPTSTTWPESRVCWLGAAMSCGRVCGRSASSVGQWSAMTGIMRTLRAEDCWPGCEVVKIMAMRAHCTLPLPWARLLHDNTHLGAPVADGDSPVVSMHPTIREQTLVLSQLLGLGDAAGDERGADDSMGVSTSMRCPSRRNCTRRRHLVPQPLRLGSPRPLCRP